MNRRGASYQKEEIDPTDVNEIYRLQQLSLRYETHFEVHIKRAKRQVNAENFCRGYFGNGYPRLL